MKVQIQIPKGWRRVTKGSIQAGDLTMAWDSKVGDWIWSEWFDMAIRDVRASYRVIRRKGAR